VATVLARPGLSGGQRSRLMALRALIRDLGNHADAAGGAEAALALARQAGDGIGAAYALHVLSLIALVLRDTRASLDLIDQALAAIGDDPQAMDLRALLLTNQATCLQHLDQPGAAMAAARQALMLAENAGTQRVGAARFAVAWLHYVNGEWDDALAELEVAAGLAGQHYLPTMVQGLTALIAGHRDDQDSMTAHLNAVGDPPLSPIETHYAGYLWQARAVAGEQAGDLAGAVASLRPCLEPLMAERMITRHLLLPSLTRLAMMTGDRQLARAAAQAAQAEAGAKSITVITAIANHCLGLATSDPEQVTDAAERYSIAGLPLDYALAQEDAAALQAERGDAAAARAALEAALAVYHRLGARWDARRAEARLSAAGVRAPRTHYRARPASGWDGLTATELRVARLVAQGRSNPDIAAELFLSRNTVQTHVSHILTKLKARSRADIVREALRASWQPMNVDACDP